MRVNHNKPKHVHRKRSTKWNPKQRIAMGLSAANRHRGEIKVTLSQPPWEKSSNQYYERE